MSEMSEWKKVRLGDVCNYTSDRVSVKTLTLDTYISTENMLPSKTGVQSASSLPTTTTVTSYKHNSILISNIRPYFKKIWFASKVGGCSNDVLCIEANELVNSKYLYYMLSQDYFFDYMMSGSKGSKMPRGDKQQIMEFELDLPPLDKQKRIADILGSLDDKIELNNKINSNLESQAQALFKRWFVDFEFPDANGNPYKSSGGEFIDSELGGIPKGWKLGDLSFYCKIKSGFAFKSSWWEDKGIRVVKIKNIQSDNTLNLNDCSFVSEDKVACAIKFKVVAGDLVIAMTGATIGKFAIVPRTKEILLVNQRVGKFFLGDTPIDKLPFIYNLLKQDTIITEIINRGQGSAQPNISPSDIETIHIIVPDNMNIDAYNNIAKPLFDTIINSNEETQKLINLRNTLLPKLMNNEIKL